MIQLSKYAVHIIIEFTDFITKAVFQSHYSVNNFFLPDNYVIDNLDNIGDIPTYIAQVRYDMI